MKELKIILVGLLFLLAITSWELWNLPPGRERYPNGDSLAHTHNGLNDTWRQWTAGMLEYDGTQDALKWTTLDKIHVTFKDDLAFIDIGDAVLQTTQERMAGRSRNNVVLALEKWRDAGCPQTDPLEKTE